VPYVNGPERKWWVVPSRHETFFQHPARSRTVGTGKRAGGGGLNIGGFVDQIEAGITGFFIDNSSSQHITQTLLHVLDLSEAAHAAIRYQAYQRVIRAFDFAQNFPVTLRWFWQREPGRRATELAAVDSDMVGAAQALKWIVPWPLPCAC